MTSLDRISPLVETFRVRASLYHAGPLCGLTTFAAQHGRGFLHVLRKGEMTVTHQVDGQLVRSEIKKPSLLFYPRPLDHAFHNAPTDDSDFACAMLDFDGGVNHPLVRTLPAVIVLPLDEAESLAPALDLLFAEIDNKQCGHHVIIDRLFELVLLHLMRWLLDHADELAMPAGLLPGLADPRLAPLLVALHESPGDDWSLTAMARTAGMSRSSLAASFKQRVGQTPASYVAQWRMMVAQDRLFRGATIAATAAQLGYSDPTAFSRAFSQHIGKPPRTWLVEARGA